jgi:hypothetical protein
VFSRRGNELDQHAGGDDHIGTCECKQAGCKRALCVRAHMFV